MSSIRLVGRLQFVLEDRQPKKGCLMLNFHDDALDALLARCQKRIKDEELYSEEGKDSFGRETEPHVTVVYGFESEVEADEVKRYVSKELRNAVEPGIVSSPQVFENDDYDVVFLPFFTSPWLEKLHRDTLAEYSIESKYPEYKPHVTVAYVKKGLGKKLARKIAAELFQGEPLEVEPDEFVYSNPDGKTYWNVL